MSSSESAVRPLEMDASVQLEPPPTVAGFDLTRFDLDFWDVVDATGRDGLLETTALEIFRSTGLVMDDAEASTRAQSGGRASWCGASTFKRWIRAVDNGYFDKAYHNSVHAADVIVTSNCYLEQLKILPQGRLPPPLSGGHGEGSTAFAIAPELVTEWRLAHLALLMAGAVHDIRHPGRMNPFMMATKHALAAEFPGRAGILEAMHAKTAMEILEVEGQDALELLQVNDKRKVREAIVELVLITDLSLQANFLKEWATRRQVAAVDEGGVSSVPGTSSEVRYDLDLQGRGEQSHADRLFLSKLVMKAADVSNPAKDFKPYLKWTSLIINEFYDQGDEERSRGLPVTSMPQCDRSNPDLAKDQIGFIMFVVKPTFQALQTFIDDTVTSPKSDTKQPTLHPMEDMVEALNRKVQFWGAFKEQVPAKERALINTPQDVPDAFIEPYVTGDAARVHSFKESVTRPQLVRRQSSLGFPSSPELGDGGVQAPRLVEIQEPGEPLACEGSPSAGASAAAKDQEIRAYLKEKVDPLFVPLVQALVREKPTDVPDFVVKYMSSKVSQKK